MKEELDSAYKELETKLENTRKELEELSKESSGSFETFSTEKETFFQEKVKGWQEQFASAKKEITALLPNALTTGLSYAYAEKREKEVLEAQKLSTSFQRAIIGLIAVSVIPFVISIIQLTNKKPLEDVLVDLPRFILSILPLYIPVLWLAYSASKKQSLSKRLIEEYTHKEVLSKTYEGLSSQINALKDEVVSADLRNQLLYTILEVSSENPGKLISDYNKADHPVMDALEKSVKLGAAVNRLNKIPGLKRISSLLERQSSKILDDAEKKVSDGLGQFSSSKTKNGEEVESEAQA